MSALSITAASVVPGSDANIIYGTAGETITAGMPVYKATSTGKYMKSDTNAGTAEARSVVGIALTGSSLGQPIAVQTSGSVTIGATLTAGVAYYLGGTAGTIVPVADLTTGDYPVSLGIATSTTVLKINITSSGAAL